MKRKLRSLAVAAGLTLVFSGATASGGLATPAVAQAPEAVLNTDFEDGTTQGWHTRGSTLIQASGAQANSGSSSLLATGRTAGWHGPAYDLLDILEAGVGIAEGWRGTIVHRVEIDRDRIVTRHKIVDPSFYQLAGPAGVTGRHDRARLPARQQELQPLLRQRRPVTGSVSGDCPIMR